MIGPDFLDGSRAFSKGRKSEHERAITSMAQSKPVLVTRICSLTDFTMLHNGLSLQRVIRRKDSDQ